MILADCQLNTESHKESGFRGFSSGPVARTLPSNGGGEGWIPDQGAKTLPASQPKIQNINQKKCCSKLVNTFLKKESAWAPPPKPLIQQFEVSLKNLLF